MNICEKCIHYLVWPETVLMVGQETGTVSHICVDSAEERIKASALSRIISEQEIIILLLLF